MADVEALPVLTAGVVLARVPLAHVDPGLAVLAVELLRTAAGIVVDPVNTRPSVHTGGHGAVIVVLLAVPAREAAGAGAGVGGR